jgi:hypothetical protein
LTAILESGLRQDTGINDLLQEGSELRAILSKSHKTARENRRRRTQEAKARKERGEPKHQLTKSPTRQFTKSI